MATITILTLTPPVVARAQKDSLQPVWLEDTWEKIEAREWLSRYWRAQLRAVLPQRQEEEPEQALSRLAAALAVEDITECVWLVQDYRILVGRTTDDVTLTLRVVEELLDWSKWTGRTRNDDTRAQSLLRSLLA